MAMTSMWREKGLVLVWRWPPSASTLAPFPVSSSLIGFGSSSLQGESAYQDLLQHVVESASDVLHVLSGHAARISLTFRCHANCMCCAKVQTSYEKRTSHLLEVSSMEE